MKLIIEKVRFCLIFIYNKIKAYSIDYWRTMFPDYKQIRQEANISDERVEEIAEEMRKVHKKYIVFRIIPLILIFLMFGLIKKVINTNEYNIFLVLYANFNMWGLITGAIGTIFLAKSFIKNKNQIALESSGCCSPNPHLQKALIYSRLDTVLGLWLMVVSIILHLFSFVLSLGIYS